MRRPTIAERAEDLARYLRSRTRNQGWCNCINPDTIDIRYRGTDPITMVFGLGDHEKYESAYKKARIAPGSELAKELGLFPYASYATDRAAWEKESALLNAAIKKVVEGRQARFKKYGYRYPKQRVKRQR